MANSDDGGFDMRNWPDLGPFITETPPSKWYDRLFHQTVREKADASRVYGDAGERKYMNALAEAAQAQAESPAAFYRRNSEEPPAIAPRGFSQAQAEYQRSIGNVLDPTGMHYGDPMSARESEMRYMPPTMSDEDIAIALLMNRERPPTPEGEEVGPIQAALDQLRVTK